jgi:hypothetical protein
MFAIFYALVLIERHLRSSASRSTNAAPAGEVHHRATKLGVLQRIHCALVLFPLCSGTVIGRPSRTTWEQREVSETESSATRVGRNDASRPSDDL